MLNLNSRAWMPSQLRCKLTSEHIRQGCVTERQLQSEPCAQSGGLKNTMCCDSGNDFEIVVVDDGSPDGTQDVVRRLQKEYGDHRIVRALVCSTPSARCCIGPDGACRVLTKGARSRLR